MAQLVPLPYSSRRSTRYSDRFHDFSVTIPRCYNVTRMSMSTVSFLTQFNAGFFGYRMLSFDLWSKQFKSGIDRQLLTVGSKQISCMLSYFCASFLVTSSLVVIQKNTNNKRTYKRTYTQEDSNFMNYLIRTMLRKYNVVMNPQY